MQWTGYPITVPVESPMPTAMTNQTVKGPQVEAFENHVAPETFVPHRESNHESIGAQDNLLQNLVPMDRSQLYDLAELLLSELIPGWDDGDLDDEDLLDDDEDDFDDPSEVYDDVFLRGAAEVAGTAVVDPVVDASYHACIQEAERYLVQHEGFAADGSVVTGLRQHLHLARVEAAQDAARAAGGTASQPRHRPPGYP